MFNIDIFKKSFDFLPLGLRINNPGCIRYVAKYQWNGQKGSYRGFASFETFEAGVRAATILLMGYLYKYRLFKVDEIIERYAPYQDGNFPRLYADRIEKISGLRKVSNNIKLLKIELPLVICAIFSVENGSEYTYRTRDKEFCDYIISLIDKYIDEYLNQVVYPSRGLKVSEI